MSDEIWKDIEGYEQIYQVSNLGNIKSLERTYWHGNRWYHQKEKLLSLKCDSAGYMSVMLYNKEHKSKRIMVHLLVARAFIPNPDNLPQINHKDENKLNNYVENLEWCTGQYNRLYGTARARSSETRRKNYVPMSEEKRKMYSVIMKEHIAKRKAEGTYWYPWKSRRKKSEV